jgi:predicted nucleic acid-binding protein
VIADASVILRAFFPDEAQARAQAVIREHVAGRIQLKAPTLLPYELSNAVWRGERRKRIKPEETDQILAALQGLDIAIEPVEWAEILPLARAFNCTAYDAAYLALAQRLGEKLITGDERLYNAVHSKLDWVLWIEGFEESEGDERLGPESPNADR